MTPFRHIAHAEPRAAARRQARALALVGLAAALASCGRDKPREMPPPPPAAKEPTAPAPVAAKPTAALPGDGKAGEAVDWEKVKEDVKPWIGHVADCQATMTPTPNELTAFADKDQLAMFGGEDKVDDRKAWIYCQAAERRYVTVETYFDPPRDGATAGSAGQGKDALLGIGPGTRVRLEIKGAVRGRVVARFDGISAGRLDAAGLDAKRPDLMSALLHPERYIDQELVCTSKGTVKPSEVDVFDRKAVALLGVKKDAPMRRGEADAGAADPAPEDHEALVAELELGDRKAWVLCEDRRVRSVSVTLFFPKADNRRVLALGRGTRVRFALKGMRNNRLVGLFRAIEGGAVEPAEGDLKAVLLDPTPHKGKTLQCKQGGVAPTPVPTGLLDAQERELVELKVDDRRTSLMCKQESGGHVSVSLYFPRGKKRELLAIRGGSVVRFRVWGVSRNRVVGTFVSTEDGAADPGPRGLLARTGRGAKGDSADKADGADKAARAGTADDHSRDDEGSAGTADWRVVALDTAEMVGKTLRCDVLREPLSSAFRYMSADKKDALPAALAEHHAALYCADGGGVAGGTRVSVYFEPSDETVADKLAKGDAVQLEVRGADALGLFAIYRGRSATAQ